MLIQHCDTLKKEVEKAVPPGKYRKFEKISRDLNIQVQDNNPRRVQFLTNEFRMKADDSVSRKSEYLTV
eukprot:UN01865